MEIDNQELESTFLQEAEARASVDSRDTEVRWNLIFVQWMSNGKCGGLGRPLKEFPARTIELGTVVQTEPSRTSTEVDRTW